MKDPTLPTPKIIVRCLKVLWELSKIFVGPPDSGGSGTPRKFLIAKKRAKITTFCQNLAGSIGEAFSHVVSDHKIFIKAFCEPEKFYTMLRRPPAICKTLKNELFYKKL